MAMNVEKKTAGSPSFRKCEVCRITLAEDDIEQHLVTAHAGREGNDKLNSEDVTRGSTSTPAPQNKELADMKTEQPIVMITDSDFEKLRQLLYETQRINAEKFKLLSHYQLQLLVDDIFENALNSPSTANKMAIICNKLSKVKVPTDAATSPEDFTTIVINKCQNQFDHENIEEKVLELKKKLADCVEPAEENELQLMFFEENKRAKMRSIQRMSFIGDLYEQQIIPTYLMVYCMEDLIDQEEEEKLQCLCKLLRTFGKQIENEVKKPDYSLWEEQFEDIFKKLKGIVNRKHNKVNKNIRSMLQDVIELRKRKWIHNLFIGSQLKAVQAPSFSHFPGSREKLYSQSRSEMLYTKNSYTLESNIKKKFDLLCGRLKVECKNQKQLENLSDLIYEKAIKELKFAIACAKMCKELSMLKVPAKNAKSPEHFVKFRALIIHKCQEEFEAGNKDEQVQKLEKELAECTDPAKKKELQLMINEESRRVRMRSVGNMRFIGELYKLKMLTSNIMVHCMNYLIDKEEEEKLQALCELLMITGQHLENEMGSVASIFNKLQAIVNRKSEKVSSGVRSMIQNVIELRKMEWVDKALDSQSKWNHERIIIKKEFEQEKCLMELMTMISGSLTSRT